MKISSNVWMLTLIIGATLLGCEMGGASFNSNSRTAESALPETAENSTTRSETGDGVDDFGACNEDARNFCSGLYTEEWATFAQNNGYTDASWKLALVDCLGQNEAKLTQVCIDSLDRRTSLNENLNTICADDRGQYCRGVEPKPGSEPQVDCLKEHYEDLSPECSEALDAHEAAKPE